MNPSPLELLQSGRFGELLTLMHDPGFREILLREADMALGVGSNLTGDPPPGGRSRGVRPASDWSWGILTDKQREALMRLSCFRGGFTPEAAAALTGEKGRALSGIIEGLRKKGWVSETKVDGQRRFLLRDDEAEQFAKQKLEGVDPGASAEAKSKHSQYYADYAAMHGGKMFGDGTPEGQPDALRDLRREHHNLLAAAESAARSGTLDTLRTLAGQLRAYLEISNLYGVMLEQFRGMQAAAEASADPALILEAMLGLARAHYRSGRIAEAKELMGRALALSRKTGPPKAEALALGSLGNIACSEADYPLASVLTEEALALRRRIGDTSGVVYSLYNLGNFCYMQGRYGEALERFTGALRPALELSDLRAQAAILAGMGFVAYMTGDDEAVRTRYQAALDLSRSIADAYGEGGALNGLGLAALMRSEYALARELCLKSLEVRRAIPEAHGEAYSLYSLGMIEHLAGDLPAALDYHEQALAQRLAINDLYGQANSLNSLGILKHACGERAAALGLLADSLAAKQAIAVHAALSAGLAVGGALLAAGGDMEAARAAMEGGLRHAARMGHVLEPCDQRIVEQGLVALARLGVEPRSIGTAAPPAEAGPIESLESLCAQTSAALREASLRPNEQPI